MPMAYADSRGELASAEADAPEAFFCTSTWTGRIEMATISPLRSSKLHHHQFDS